MKQLPKDLTYKRLASNANKKQTNSLPGDLSLLSAKQCTQCNLRMLSLDSNVLKELHQLKKRKISLLDFFFFFSCLALILKIRLWVVDSRELCEDEDSHLEPDSIDGAPSVVD